MEKQKNQIESTKGVSSSSNTTTTSGEVRSMSFFECFMSIQGFPYCWKPLYDVGDSKPETLEDTYLAINNRIRFCFNEAIEKFEREHNNV